jgi:hypothetical protein
MGVIYSVTSIPGAAPHRAIYAILKQSGFNVNKRNSNYIYHYLPQLKLLPYVMKTRGRVGRHPRALA